MYIKEETNTDKRQCPVSPARVQYPESVLIRLSIASLFHEARTTASTVLAGTRLQERTRSTNSELEGRSQQRPTKDGVHLG